MLRKMQPPIVPPTMVPIGGLLGTEVDSASVEVGVVAGGAVTVTVFCPASTLELLTPQLRCAVAVNWLAAQPCCVIVVWE